MFISIHHAFVVLTYIRWQVNSALTVSIVISTNNYAPEFSHCKVRVKSKFDFLGFEFRWGVNRRGRPTLKRRTSRNKLFASIAKFKEWFKENCRIPKKLLFIKLNRKLKGYYNYYGVRGNYKSLNHFVYRVWQLLYKWLNRCSQRKSYNIKGFKALVNDFGIARPRICHDF